jgi:hypothetical protein
MYRNALGLRASRIGQGFQLSSGRPTAEVFLCCGCPLSRICGVWPVRLCVCSFLLLLLDADEFVQNNPTFSSCSANRTTAD